MATFKVSNVTPTEVNIQKTKGIQNAKEFIDCTRVIQGSKVTDYRRNGFVDTVVACYNEHHNLVLRPDDVWLAIVNQFSFYVSGNAENLRDKLVVHREKVELEVIGSGTLDTADYADLSMKMSELLKKHTNDKIADWIIPSFSTTTETDRIVGAISLMSTMKKYFNYKYSLKCGIPSITLQGTNADWENIVSRGTKLHEYHSEWAEQIVPILEKFAQASRGEIDKDWWNRICHKSGGGSGPTYLSGWIVAFCMFDEEGCFNSSDKIDMEDIPAGYTTVDVLVDDNGVKYNTKMFAGAMSNTYIHDTMFPCQSWCICEKK